MAKDASLARSGVDERAGLGIWPVDRIVATPLQECSCNRETVHAFRAYLRKHFPGCAVRDFHERTRVTQAGLPARYADHHVVSTTDWETAYYAVLSGEMLGDSLSHIRERLSAWCLAEKLRAHGIVIVSTAGLSSL